ncbi:flavin-dependent oxidoreductase [Roseomonas sp. BN140053]|uniref:flavin-dependent oxidoreductase n=1 Tax=Roseomonas sp. BN140053 TaxID=3391898 RepID=UPI0039E895DE
MKVAIIGGGIAGLALALNLHERGIGCQVYEAAPEVKELGVGITLLPHAMRELTALGLQESLRRAGIENRASAFFNRFGQLIYQEPRGALAGYAYPEIGIHRGRLHTLLFETARERLGAERITLDRRCAGFTQDENGVSLHFQTSTGAAAPDATADIAVACDGVNSAIRKQFYPGEDVVFTGINTWRGVTRHKPILDGRTYIRVGSIKRGKIVIYPIIDDVDGQGNQLINWTTEIQSDRAEKNDWNKPGHVEDFIEHYADWHFPWCDVPELIRNSEVLFEYPMVDKDPVDRWTFGRVTVAGDAAHPMYPRGSNGSAQSLIDVRTLADLLAKGGDPREALRAYEAARTGPTAKVVRTNRSNPPDFINIRVEELTNDQPFDNLDDFVTQAELKELSDSYKRVAGFDLTSLR